MTVPVPTSGKVVNTAPAPCNPPYHPVAWLVSGSRLSYWPNKGTNCPQANPSSCSLSQTGAAFTWIGVIGCTPEVVNRRQLVPTGLSLAVRKRVVCDATRLGRSGPERCQRAGQNLQQGAVAFTSFGKNHLKVDSAWGDEHRNPLGTVSPFQNLVL
jgi:hypothetical protein